MTLADTPKHWPTGPGISTLHALLLFAGIPLLVILAVSLMVLAPGWVKGPRYRLGQPWEARTEWFGPGLKTEPSVAGASSAGSSSSVPDAEPPGSASAPGGGTSTEPPGQPDSGGASAGW